jgi:ribosomal protein S6--L-glutamate ligase
MPPSAHPLRNSLVGVQGAEDGKIESASNQDIDRVAIGLQLKSCPLVRTVGVKCNLEDYSPEELRLIRNAATIYFPTPHFVEAIAAMGKKTFPSVECYRYLGDKIKQTVLFKLLDIPIPNTRFFYGSKQREAILKAFPFPFVGKIAVGSGGGEGVHLIEDSASLDAYLRTTRVAYIQEYVRLRRDLRIVILGKRVAVSYWKEAAPGEFRTNLARGGRVLPDPVPHEALELALKVATRCNFDHTGLDLCQHQGGFLVIEANMNFGKKGFRMADIDYKELLNDLVKSGEI